MSRFRTVICREGYDYPVAAVISVDETEDVHDEATLLEALKKAVADWVKNTQEGKRTWEASCHDFNIGDLALCEIPGIYLVAVGIRNMEIEITEYAQNWTFDTVLYDDFIEE